MNDIPFTLILYKKIQMKQSQNREEEKIIKDFFLCVLDIYLLILVYVDTYSLTHTKNDFLFIAHSLLSSLSQVADKKIKNEVKSKYKSNLYANFTHICTILWSNKINKIESL